MRLEDLTPNASVRGLVPDAAVTVVQVQWYGSEALELTYKDASGRVESKDPRTGDCGSSTSRAA